MLRNCVSLSTVTDLSKQEVGNIDHATTNRFRFSTRKLFFLAKISGSFNFFEFSASIKHGPSKSCVCKLME